MSEPIAALLTPFETLCADPYAYAREAKADGRTIAGLMCTYAPAELLHAAGYLPVRIIGRQGGTPLADEKLQPYICSFARSTLDSALAAELDFMDVVVFAHTCDTMQNLAEIWRENRPDTPLLRVALPNKMQDDTAVQYYTRALQRTREELEALSGPIPEGVLAKSIRLYHHHQHWMRRLYAQHRQQPERLTGTQMAAVVLASYLMDREDHLEWLVPLVEALEDHAVPPTPTQPRVLVTGSVCQSAIFIEAIETAGCLVADDDLCMGGRSFDLPDTTAADSFDALVQRYMERPPCPAFLQTCFSPGDHLVQQAKASQVDGVIFLLTKFCDPWQFDYPHMQQTLEDAGYPTLRLEIEQHLPVPEQLKTRTEAFAELLAMRKGL